MTRTLQWLFLVSVLLFVSGIGFVIAAGRTVRSAAPATPVTAAACHAGDCHGETRDGGDDDAQRRSNLGFGEHNR